MKDKLIQIRADAEFLSKLEYLRSINGFKTISGTIRKIVEKEWRKERHNVSGSWRHYEGMLTCSECGEEIYDDIMELLGDDVPKFCPNCGAKMFE